MQAQVVPPLRLLISPALNGATVPQTGLTLTATATRDDREASLSEVRFYLDDALVQTVSAAPFRISIDVGPGQHRIHATTSEADGTVVSSEPAIVVGGPTVAATRVVDREGLGATTYNTQCAPCHGAPPGGNPRRVGEFNRDINFDVLVASSYHAIKPGVVSTHGETHLIGGANSVNAWVNNRMTEAEQVSLAAYVASRNPHRFGFSGSVKVAGAGVPGAALRISSEYNPGLQVVTDSEGNYSVAGLPQGDYRIEVTGATAGAFSPTHHELWRTAYVLYVDGVPNHFRPVETVDFTARAAVTGAISLAAGRVPAPNISVEARQGNSVVAQTTTGPDGRYTLLLSNGDFVIRPVAPAAWVFAQAERAVSVSDIVIAGVDFTATAPPPYVIAGVVTSETGEPLAGAEVALEGVEGARATTGPDGRYNLAVNELRSYTVTPSLANHRFLPARRTIDLGIFGASDVNFLGVLQYRVVFGNVRTLADRPIPGATIRAGAATAVSLDDGSFYLPVLAGNYQVSVEKAGHRFASSTQTVTVQDRDAGPVDFFGGLTRVYVAANGNDDSAGDSWASARRSIQVGIDSAAEAGEVWVSAGQRFGVGLKLRYGVSLYGGFAGTETAVHQRNISVNPTVLDGRTFPLDGTSRNVIEVEWHEITATQVIDGFTIQYGIATSPSHGGGIHAQGVGRIRVSNNRLLNNRASFGGGGIYIGSGLYATVVNNFVYANTGRIGGGIYLDYGSRPELVANNVIVANRSDGPGSGIAVNSTSALIAHNTISSNRRNDFSKAEDFAAIAVGGVGAVILANNIVAFNEGGINNTTAGSLSASHNLLFRNGVNYIGLTAGAGDISADPLFVEIGSDFHLRSGSPAIDRASGEFVAPGMLDLDMAARVVGPAADIGADEFVSNAPPVARLLEPAEGVVAFAGGTLRIRFEASDSDGSIQEAAILRDGAVLAAFQSGPYEFQWTDLVEGEYQISLRAVDNLGAMVQTKPIRVTVQAAPQVSPELRATLAANSLILQWTANSGGWVVEQSSDITNPNGWSPAEAEIRQNGTFFAAQVDRNPTGVRFFRLRK